MGDQKTTSTIQLEDALLSQLTVLQTFQLFKIQILCGDMSLASVTQKSKEQPMSQMNGSQYQKQFPTQGRVTLSMWGTTFGWMRAPKCRSLSHVNSDRRSQLTQMRSKSFRAKKSKENLRKKEAGQRPSN